MRCNHTHAALCLMLAVGLVAGAHIPAFATSDTAQQIVGQAIEADVSAMNEQDRWQAEQTAMNEEIRQLKSESIWLTFQEKKYSRYVNATQAKVAELERAKLELEQIESGLEPYLFDLVDRLKAFVDTDLPFLREERAKRLAFLQQSLDDHTLSVSEKLR